MRNRHGLERALRGLVESRRLLSSPEACGPCLRHRRAIAEDPSFSLSLSWFWVNFKRYPDEEKQ